MSSDEECLLNNMIDSDNKFYNQDNNLNNFF